MRLRILKSVFSFVPDRLWLDLERVSGWHLGIDIASGGACWNDCALRRLDDSTDFDWEGPWFDVSSRTYTLALNLLKWQVALNWTRNRAQPSRPRKRYGRPT